MVEKASIDEAYLLYSGQMHAGSLGAAHGFELAAGVRAKSAPFSVLVRRTVTLTLHCSTVKAERECSGSALLNLSCLGCSSQATRCSAQGF